MARNIIFPLFLPLPLVPPHSEALRFRTSLVHSLCIANLGAGVLLLLEMGYLRDVPAEGTGG
jgi:hypothetical protein